MSRVVMFVRNDVTRDARVLREAAALGADGHEVTIVGTAGDRHADLPASESRDAFTILRVASPQQWQRRWSWIRSSPWRAAPWVAALVGADLRRGPAGWFAAFGVAVVSVIALPWVAWRAALRLVRGDRDASDDRARTDDSLDWLIRWRYGIAGWGSRAAAAAPLADIVHAHDLDALPAALAAVDRSNGPLVYDSHELFLDAASAARRASWARGILRRFEGRAVRRAAAVVTVNEELAAELGRRYAPKTLVVVHNCPPRWDPPSVPEDRIRDATGIEDRARIALYHGIFLQDRGLRQLALAALTSGLEELHVVYLGYGRERDSLLALAGEERFGGRLHVLDAVPPDEVVAWVASADVDVSPIQPTTLNHRLATPNKVFESLAAGVPVVVSDLPAMRRIVMDDPDGPLGAVCDPASPVSIGAAIRSIVSLEPVTAADLRARCLRAAHERWNWETESARLVGLYRTLGETRSQ